MMKTLICFAALVLGTWSVAEGSEWLRIHANGHGQNQCPDSTAQVCPLGDFGDIRVTVSDIGGLEGDTVTVYAAISSGSLCFCPGEEPPRTGTLDYTQYARFDFTAMGGCGQISFWATSSDGSSTPPTDPIFVSSPDINASCMVSAVDLALFAMDYGQQGRRCSDFDCDGGIDAIDLSLFARAYGHVCMP